MKTVDEYWKAKWSPDKNGDNWAVVSERQFSWTNAILDFQQHALQTDRLGITHRSANRTGHSRDQRIQRPIRGNDRPWQVKRPLQLRGPAIRRLARTNPIACTGTTDSRLSGEALLRLVASAVAVPSIDVNRPFTSFHVSWPDPAGLPHIDKTRLHSNLSQWSGLLQSKFEKREGNTELIRSAMDHLWLDSPRPKYAVRGRPLVRLPRQRRAHRYGPHEPLCSLLD
jgi:hypothetical protein